MALPFDTAFEALTGWPPFRWQRRLYDEHFLVGDVPAALDLPTGLGKTSVMAIWYLAWKAGARLPRRLVYVVDRRAVVDQATAEAEKIKAKHPDLRISTLRGQHADNREWLENPAEAAIVVGTVDMIGSRLLFSGYGVSRKTRSYQAGLLGADTLLVLDESHLVPPFEELMRSIAGDDAARRPRDAPDREIVPPFKLLSLSATGRKHDGKVFRLQEEDRSDELVSKRIGARKRAAAVAANGRKLDVALAEEAWRLAEEAGGPIRCLVYCNSRDVAEKVRDALARRGKNEVETELFVGARRVRERVKAAERLQDLGFLAGSGVELQKHAFLVATSAGEVGVDLDADRMVCDLAPWERMVQRLGRVNRRGDGNARIVVVHEAEPRPKKPDDPKPEEMRAAIAWRSLALLGRLPLNECGHGASPAALAALKTDHADEVERATTPEPLRPALSRALVDAWSMTSLEIHAGRPEVAPWLRGWVEDEQTTTLVWRKFLPVRVQGGTASEREVADFFEAAPPHLTEKLETQTHRVSQWLLDRAKKLAEAVYKAKTRAEADGAGDTDIADPPPLDAQKVVAITIGRSGGDAQVFTLDDLTKASDASREKGKLEHDIKDRTLILDARMGGLSEDGLFDPKEEKAAPTPDTDADWEKAISFRVRSVAPDAESPNADWHKPYLLDLRRDGDGNPLRQLRVEKYKDATATEEERSLSSKRAQLLEQHQEWTACKAQELVNALGLAGDIGDAIVLAARLHDEGKKADIWQRAFSAKADGIYAKTTGPFKRSALGGYRHEFGSLRHVEAHKAFGALSEDLQCLVLHLVAAHHGRARPVIETDGCEELPPVLAVRARDVALRFARLQKRFGPWGLAWLEALLRAADQQASRDNDRGKAPDG